MLTKPLPLHAEVNRFGHKATYASLLILQLQNKRLMKFLKFVKGSTFEIQWDIVPNLRPIVLYRPRPLDDLN